ncbi:hypothetical protein Sjap_011967 [Stephania japonica]|uniref:Uncharacterized protein n=1 Tax=Stephania japonica TaxID=461633 RepID=A0AAP0JDC6_9MAGN
MEGIEDLPRQMIPLRFPFAIRFAFVRLFLDQIYRTSSSNADFQITKDVSDVALMMDKNKQTGFQSGGSGVIGFRLYLMASMHITNQ